MLVEPNALAAGLGIGVFIVILLIMLAVIAFEILIFWRIASKAGYHGAMSLLMLVPLANVVVVVLFAFSRWPVQQQLEQLQGGATQAIPPYSRSGGM